MDWLRQAQRVVGTLLAAAAVGIGCYLVAWAPPLPKKAKTQRIYLPPPALEAMDPPVGDGGHLRAVDGTGPENVWMASPVLKWDGTAWHAMGDEGLPGEVGQIVVAANGEVFATAVCCGWFPYPPEQTLPVGLWFEWSSAGWLPVSSIGFKKDLQGGVWSIREEQSVVRWEHGEQGLPLVCPQGVHSPDVHPFQDIHWAVASASDIFCSDNWQNLFHWDGAVWSPVEGGVTHACYIWPAGEGALWAHHGQGRDCYGLTHLSVTGGLWITLDWVQPPFSPAGPQDVWAGQGDDVARVTHLKGPSYTGYSHKLPWPAGSWVEGIYATTTEVWVVGREGVARLTDKSGPF